LHRHYESYTEWFVMCTDCLMRGPQGCSGYIARIAWNALPRSVPAEIVEALRPFAHIAEWSDEDTRWAITRDGWVRSITDADLQRARAALAALKHEQPEVKP